MADKDRGEKLHEQAAETGVLGTPPDTIENEAYTLQGQGPETAKREREQREQLRSEQKAASMHEDDDKSSSKSKSSSSSKSSGSSSS